MFCHAFSFSNVPEKQFHCQADPSVCSGDPTEVGYLGVLAGIQEDVLGFEVSVDHHVPVAVVYSWDNLLEKTASFCVLHLKDTI